VHVLTCPFNEILIDFALISTDMFQFPTWQAILHTGLVERNPVLPHSKGKLIAVPIQVQDSQETCSSGDNDTSSGQGKFPCPDQSNVCWL
jgi:hypothetical protein